MNNPQEKIAYALWMVRSAAKQSAVSTAAGIGMMTAGWIILCHAAFGLHKPEERLPWSAAALALIAPSLAVIRHGEERGNWAIDGRAVFRWGRAQWQEKLMLPPKQDDLQAIAHLPSAIGAEIPLLNLKQFINASLVFIIGEQGSGKTTLAKLIATERERSGHSIQVVDPHGSSAEWGNWEIVGAGRDFASVNQFMLDFDQGVTDDYQLYSRGERNFPHRTVIGDELTQWGDKCESAPAFITSSCSDIRKINRHVILITHADTIDKIGGAKGLRATIDQSAIKVVLESDLAADGSYIPTGFGWLTFPRKEAVRIRIPREPEPLALRSPPSAKQLPDAQPGKTPSDKTRAAADFDEPLRLIIEAAKANSGCISVRDAMRYKGLRNKFVADEIKAFFYLLEGLSLGTVQVEERGDRLVFWLFSEPRDSP